MDPLATRRASMDQDAGGAAGTSGVDDRTTTISVGHDPRAAPALILVEQRPRIHAA